MKSATLHEISILPGQCRAARALLNLSRAELAGLAKVSERTLVDFERGARTPLRSTLAAIRRALESAGIEFIPEDGKGPGVRLAKPSAE